MRIARVEPMPDLTLLVVDVEGRAGRFDVRPYLAFEVFEKLHDPAEFRKVSNGGHYVEWECGADLSADTIEAKMSLVSSV
jgi:hypothetical protein